MTGTDNDARGAGGPYESDRKIAASSKPRQQIVSSDGLSTPDSTAIPGDLTPGQIEAVRASVSGQAQLQTASEAVKMLATQQAALFTDANGKVHLPAATEEALLHQMGLAEANARLAKSGLTPIDTVEGKIKVLQFVTQHVLDTAGLELRAKHQVEDQLLKYRQLLITQSHKLEKARLEAMNDELQAKHAQILLQHDLVVRQKGAIADINLEAKALEISRQEKELDVDRKRIEIEAGRRRLDVAQRIARTKSAIDHWVGLRRQYSRVYRPILRWAIIVLIPLIIVSNLVADGEKYENTFILGQVNRTWDGMYMPIRDGIIRTIDHMKSLGDNEDKSPTPQPSKKPGAK